MDPPHILAVLKTRTKVVKDQKLKQQTKQMQLKLISNLVTVIAFWSSLSHLVEGWMVVNVQGVIVGE